MKKLTPADGAGNNDPAPELTVNEVADALIPAASTVCALLAAKSVSAIYPPGFGQQKTGNDSNLLIVFYVQIMPDDFVMQLHR
ncbi:hypothetical protein MZE61_22485, partial [Escherichia coli]|nr:hypothetical protein [Escherichia coli]